MKDIDRAWEAIKNAVNPRIHTFIATSDIHLKYKLKKTKDEVLSIIEESVSHSVKYTKNVEFSCEDATRTDLDFLYRAVEVAIKAGATTINIPDTVGYSVPSEFGAIIRKLHENVDNVSNITISVHCHNDLGLAVANSLAAIHEGARQVECTINGLGERAGNASLEELVMALKVRNDLNPFVTRLDTKQIYPCSKLVSSVTGVSVQPNKAIVGANAFAHEAGIHQDGVLKESMTYEIMDPGEVGIPSNHIVLGKHSGRHAFRDRLNQFGYELSEDNFEIAFLKFKELCDKKKYVFDEDIFSLVNEEFMRLSDFYQLGTIECSSVTEGMDAQAEVSVSIKDEGFFARGKGASTDVIVASAKAFINALNNLRWRKNHPKVASTKGI